MGGGPGTTTSRGRRLPPLCRSLLILLLRYVLDELDASTQQLPQQLLPQVVSMMVEVKMVAPEVDFVIE